MAEHPSTASEQDKADVDIPYPGTGAANEILMAWFEQDEVARFVLSSDLSIVLYNKAGQELVDRHDILAIIGDKLTMKTARQRDSETARQRILKSAISPEILVSSSKKLPNILLKSQMVEFFSRNIFFVSFHEIDFKEHYAINLPKLCELTPTESSILNDMIVGNSVREIANLRKSSYETIRTHIRNIYKKFGVKSRSKLMGLINYGKNIISSIILIILTV